jgi:ABC-type nitrate/sulfonate/bicarbonate transport system permease component
MATAERTTRRLSQIGVFVAALLLWEVASAVGIFPRSSFPSMTDTLSELVADLQTADLWHSVAMTLQGWAIGVFIGSVLALSLGTLIGINLFAYRSVIPVVEFLKTIPVIAIVPLAIIVYGPTMKMKVFLVAFTVFWPLVIQVVYGVRAVDPVVRDTARIMKLGLVRRITTVTMPSAAPFIATGMRLAAAVGLIVAVIAELIGGAAGLGSSILQAQNAGPSELPRLYSFILMTGVVGVVVTGIFSLVESRVLHWHESQRNSVSKAA